MITSVEICNIQESFLNQRSHSLGGFLLGTNNQERKRTLENDG